MEIGKFFSRNNFSVNKKKIKYQLLPNKKSLLLTNKNLTLPKRKNKERTIKSLSPYSIHIPKSTTNKKSNNSSQTNINLINSKDNISVFHKNSFDVNLFSKIILKKKNKSLSKDKSGSNIKKELEKVKVRLMCKLIEDNYKYINDIDCILESPHRGIEKMPSCPKTFENNAIKRAISGYNIRNFNRNSNVLNDISKIKQIRVSSSLLRKIIDYSSNHRIKNISEIINENIKKYRISNRRNIYLNIPLKNIRNKENKLNENRTFNYKNNKKVYFESFIPEDYKITSKKLNKIIN